MDESGEGGWSWYQEGEEYYLHREVIKTQEGTYLILGNGKDFSYEGDYLNYLTKIDPNGNVYTRLVQGQVSFDQGLSCTFNAIQPARQNHLVELVRHQARCDFNSLLLSTS